LDKNVVLDLTAVCYILAGSTLGVILRIFVRKNFRKKLGFNINHIAIVNILAALFLGVFLALNLSNKYMIFLFYVGFLGCLSTFSSFIYELFRLIQSKQYKRLLFHYIELLLISFFSFWVGFFVMSILRFE